MRPLVIVRPQPGAEATAASAQSLGLESMVMPLFAVDSVEWSVPDPADYDALLLTSANAIRHGGGGLVKLLELTAHCVGEATASAARDCGFGIGIVGTKDLDSLLEAIQPDARLLHLCGVDRRPSRAALQTIDPVPVYESTALPVPVGFRGIEGAVVAIHSPRAAARLAVAASEAGADRGTVSIAAISEAAAAAAGEGWGQVRWAHEPSDAALLALAATLCNNPD